MLVGSRTIWMIVVAVCLGVAGFKILEQQQDRSDATEATASIMGIVVSPQNVIVERTENGGASQVEFTLKNSGRAPVLVQSVETSCGCSIAQPMADRTIHPAKTQLLVISAEPPAFDSRIVQVELQLVDPIDTSRKETIRLQMKLIGKPLPASRVYDLPQSIEMSNNCPGEVVRLFGFNTIEENEDAKWITDLSSTSTQIKAEILNCESLPRSKGGVQRTYHCRLTAEVPHGVNEILAGTVRLMSGTSVATESAVFRVVVHRRIAWKAFPAVLKRPPLEATEDTIHSVAVQAIDGSDVESLLRLEIAHAPNGAIVEWLPSDEKRLRKLAVRFPAGSRSVLTQSESISLIDPQSRDSLVIQFAQQSE